MTSVDLTLGSKKVDVSLFCGGEAKVLGIAAAISGFDLVKLEAAIAAAIAAACCCFVVICCDIRGFTKIKGPLVQTPN